jgi:hypothetical protein
VAATPSQGGFDPGAGRWDLGGLAPGATAVLQLAARAAAPGNHVVVSEVATSSVPDPTSIPGNGAAEDDRAAVLISVPGAAGAAASPGTTRLRPRALRVKVVRTPRRGKAKRLTVTGRLVLPRARPPARCAGRVLVRATAGKRVVASRRVALRARRGVCGYRAVLRPKRTRSAAAVKVTARFLGTPQLLVRSSRTLNVRIR